MSLSTSYASSVSGNAASVAPTARLSQLTLSQALAQTNALPLTTVIMTALSADHVGTILPAQLISWYKGEQERVYGIPMESQPEPSLVELQDAYFGAVREYLELQIQKHSDSANFKMWVTTYTNRVTTAWTYVMR